MTRRILITGSRAWEDVSVIRDALAQVYSRGAVLISGACPKGADRICEQEWQKLGGEIELHPAQWNVHNEDCPVTDPGNGSCWKGRQACKRAGFRRNADMVNSDADLCLAFIYDGSAGASGTVNLAQRAGIETIVYTNKD